MKLFWSKSNKKRKSAVPAAISVQTKSKPKAPTTPKPKPEPWKPPAPTYILPPPPKVTKPDIQEPIQKPDPKKVYSKSREVHDNFMRTFNRLADRRRDWDIWTDFVTMTACSISNVVDKSHYKEREELYLQIINKYNKQEQQLFPELIAYTVLALDENPEQDFLGDIYTELGLNSKKHKQIFTPYSVCQVMVDLIFDNIVDQVQEKGFVEIHDCCCGGGATLIAAANMARKKLGKAGLNFQNHVLFSGQDVEYLVTMMCYIQLSLLGVAGYFKVGNALTEPITTGDTLENYWFTPIYFSDVWHYRRIFWQLDSLMKGDSDGEQQRDS